MECLITPLIHFISIRYFWPNGRANFVIFGAFWCISAVMRVISGFGSIGSGGGRLETNYLFSHLLLSVLSTEKIHWKEDENTHQTLSFLVGRRLPSEFFNCQLKFVWKASAFDCVGLKFLLSHFPFFHFYCSNSVRFAIFASPFHRSLYVLLLKWCANTML